MNAAEDGKKIRGLMHDDYWIDVGTPEKLLELNKYLEQEEFKS